MKHIFHYIHFLFVGTLLLSLNLHAQSLSTIDGIVFNDLNGDGVQDDGEQGIPGVLVELRGGTNINTLNIAVLTGTDGSYSLSGFDLPDATNYHLRYYYPREAFNISSAGFTTSGNIITGHIRSASLSIAGGIPLDETIILGLTPVEETLTFSNVKPLAGTNWGPETVDLPYSPAGYGILKEVKLYINYHVVNPSAVITNNDGSNPGSGRFQTGATFTVGTPFDGVGIPEATFTYLHPLVTLAAGESISESNLHNSQGAVWHEYDADYLSSFVGAGTFGVQFESTGSSAIVVNSGNVTGTISTLSAPSVFVVYIYEEGSLPVKLASFTAYTEGETALLRWTTTEEVDSFAFEIERSSNAKTWQKIGAVSAQGQSDKTQNYTFSDPLPFKGTSYYRLKMVDRDGTFSHSEIKSVQSLSGKEVSAVVYPNPASDFVFVKDAEPGAIHSIEIVNAAGLKVLSNNTYDSLKGVEINALAKGLYILTYKRTTTGEQVAQKLFISR